MDEISSFEKRRARNLVWSAAGTQDFEPPVLIYDSEDKADLYWNSIIGSVYLHFDWPMLEEFYRGFAEAPRRAERENLFWIAMEHLAYHREKGERPVFPSLRRAYVERTLADMNAEKAAINHDDTLSYRILRGHLQRAERLDDRYNCDSSKKVNQERDSQEQGESKRQQFERLTISERLTQVHLSEEEQEILDGIELPEGLNTEEVIRRLNSVFDKHLSHGHRNFLSKLPKIPLMNHILDSDQMLLGAGGKGKKKIRPRLMWDHSDPTRGLVMGTAEHTFEERDREDGPGFFGQSQQAQENYRKYLSNYFGQPLYHEEELREKEKELCTEADTGCHLFYTRGEYAKVMEQGNFVAIHNRSGDKHRRKNESAYEENRLQYHHVIERLTSRIRNSMLVHLESQEVRAVSGRLMPERVWRGVTLKEKMVFRKELPGDSGNITVDLLLDSSYSQVSRQATIAAQAYILAESLTKCQIPVRISSFCTMNGYTIMTVFRDYQETDKNDRVFGYFAAGCNRDGLGIRMVTERMKDNPAEHRLLIVLSDCKPFDAVKMKSAGAGTFIDYAGDTAVNITAANVRRAIAQGITVMCIYTGLDEDLPAARKIYDKNFARIRSLDLMADTVGNLLQNVISSLGAV